MSDAFGNSFDEVRLRAADYRMRAEELRMRAASITWADARSNILKVAETYDALRRPSRTLPSDRHGHGCRGKSP